MLALWFSLLANSRVRPLACSSRALAFLWRRPTFRSRSPEQAEMPAHAGAVLIGFQSGGADAECGQLVVTVFGIAGDADRADRLPVWVADQHAAAFRKNLLAARGD